MSDQESVLNELNILLVDDEEDLLEVTSFQLEDVGVNCILANNYIEALDAIDNNKIDLILSDMRMPEVDGLGLLQKVRDKYPTLPVVLFLSGYSDYSEKDLIEKGALGMISKPLQIEKLEEMIRLNIDKINS